MKSWQWFLILSIALWVYGGLNPPLRPAISIIYGLFLVAYGVGWWLARRAKKNEKKVILPEKPVQRVKLKLPPLPDSAKKDSRGLWQWLKAHKKWIVYVIIGLVLLGVPMAFLMYVCYLAGKCGALGRIYKKISIRVSRETESNGVKKTKTEVEVDVED